MNFLRPSIVQFWASRYIVGVDHTFDSKVMGVWISWELPWSISRVSIYDARESDIRVNSNSPLNFSGASIQFWASRYIIGVDHTFDSKVMAVWICRVLPLSISRVSIYDARESDIKRIGEGRLKKVYNQLKAGKYKIENANVKIGAMEKRDLSPSSCWRFVTLLKNL